MVFEGVDKKLGGIIKKNLHIANLKIKQDFDFIQLIVGLNRMGKTEFAKLISYYMDPSVNINRWAYSAEQFEKIVDDPNIPKGACIIWDESDDFTGHYSSDIIQTFKKKFKRIASWNFIIILITPTFFDMNKYFAVMRTDCLWHVYATPDYDEVNDVYHANRGKVMFYGKESKRQLYFKGKKDDWNMNAVKSDFYDSFGRVPVDYPVDHQLLVAKKDEAMRNMLKKEEKFNNSTSSVRKAKMLSMGKLRDRLLSQHNIKWKLDDYCSIYDIGKTAVKNYFKDYDSFMQNGVYSSSESEPSEAQ